MFKNHKINKKKILPVCYPIITSFTGYADSLAILTSSFHAMKWVYSNYIQFYVTQIIPDVTKNYYPTSGYAPGFFNDFNNHRLANVINDGIFLDREKCPYLNVFEIPFNIITKLSLSFVDYIKMNIDNDMYTYGYADVSQIQAYGYLQSSEQTFHQVFIYGYEDDKRIFHFADFLRNNKYTFATASYDEVERAYKNITSFVMPLVKSLASIQKVDNASFAFDYEYVIGVVNDYLNPNEQSCKNYEHYAASYFAPLHWNVKCFIGINSYNFMREFVKIQEQLGIYPLDYRPHHAFLEHKEMMLARLIYFLSEAIIHSDKSRQIEQYSQVKQNMLTVRNLILKYNTKKESNLLDTIDSLLMETSALEYRVLSDIFC